MEYKVIGLMSGSSMDGLDIAYCVLTEIGGQWQYAIEHAAWISFPEKIALQINAITQIPVPEFMKLHTAFGTWMGEQVNAFIEANQLHHKVHIIGSHGHTAFHFPESYTSVQIGCGAALASATGINVVSDLRAMDVSLQGNGAPIVPIAEKLLFADYQMFLNIGGICNISYRNNDGAYFAKDVCPANRVLNEVVSALNKSYDNKGIEASKGNVVPELLQQLNAIEYYQKQGPKSLANELGTQIILPILQSSGASVQDQLRTMVEHIAEQIAMQVQALHQSNESINMLITGGGAYNTFLIECIQQKIINYNVQITIPDAIIIENKEALAMALIAVLRWREETNVMASVTGASRDSVGGALWLGN
jgi:anhydro-N-acetylmuramic acid kinase